MLPGERIEKIKEYIIKHGKARVDELSKIFNVSEVTIRKDLNSINRDNVNNIKRTHGGAVAFVSQLEEHPIDAKYMENKDLKIKIANTALKFIRDDKDIILIDGGSTTYYLAKFLLKYTNLKLLTNSIPVVNLLRNTKNDIIVLGGNLRETSFTTVGYMTYKILEEYNIDTAFMGVTSIDADGNLYSPSENEAITKEAIIKHANFKILMADYTKIPTKSFKRFSHLSEYNVFITNKEINPKILESFRKYTEVILT